MSVDILGRTKFHWKAEGDFLCSKFEKAAEIHFRSTWGLFPCGGLLELHFFGVEVDLVRVCFDEHLEDVYKVFVLVKERRHLRNKQSLRVGVTRAKK